MRFAKLIDPSRDTLVGDFLPGDFSGYHRIIRQLEFRRGYNRGLIAHCSVIGDFDILDLRDRQHPQVVLPDGLVETFAQQPGGELFLDILREAILNERLRGFAGAVAGDSYLSLEIARDIRPFLGDLVGGQLDTQGDQAIRLGFNDNVHVQTSQVSTAARRAQPANCR